MSIISQVPNPVGRPRKFKNAQELWEKFIEYCEYVDNNPWQIKSASNSLNEGASKSNNMRQDVSVRQRAYTLYGFCAYAGICSKWGDFKRTNIDRRDFEKVMFAIENVVCSQQLDGALINQFDGSIVARLNGLADKQITEITGKDGKDFSFPKLNSEDIEELKRLNGLQ